MPDQPSAKSLSELTPSVSIAGAHTDEQDLAAAIGQQVREFRNQHQLTVVEVAKQANMSPGMLSKIENGNTSPSLATLHSLSRAFNVPVTAFFRKYEQQQQVCYTPADKRLIIERRGSRVGHEYELLGQGVGGEVAVAPYMITMTDESEIFPTFQHDGVEFIHMLEGEVVYRHGRQNFRLRAGDSLFFEADTPHGPAALIELPIRFIAVLCQSRKPG